MIGAVDIGGTKFAVGMISRAGEVLARQEVPSAAEDGPQAGLGRIIAMLRETARQAGGELEGIGIGCTGPVYPLTGKVGRIEFLPGWEGLNLAAEIEKPFGLKVALENDADASALGEYAWGAGQGSRRFLYVTVSTGIGVGFVIDGQLYRGVEGAHPEIGHHVIDPSGPQCFCGAHGCWESLAGGLALARFADRPTAQAACEAAESGDPQALQAVAAEAKYLGLGIANLVSTLYSGYNRPGRRRDAKPLPILGENRTDGTGKLRPGAVRADQAGSRPPRKGCRPGRRSPGLDRTLWVK